MQLTTATATKNFLSSAIMVPVVPASRLRSLAELRCVSAGASGRQKMEDEDEKCNQLKICAAVTPGTLFENVVVVGLRRLAEKLLQLRLSGE
ncbi:hypothetical protein FQA47_020380 [Oryzias melastigma]|uniref:Uncharacterized protein n=1 Tax=Oryzias melastigma TaxID=30732 RepID=A0A834C773_ORYME|nr:hypothetical protein FQA47_020380 [Oryzias melastigma]